MHIDGVHIDDSQTLLWYADMYDDLAGSAEAGPLAPNVLHHGPGKRVARAALPVVHFRMQVGCFAVQYHGVNLISSMFRSLFHM